jgi:hypothetical protein
LRGCPGGGLDCRRLIKKNFEKRQFEGLLLYGPVVCLRLMPSLTFERQFELEIFDSCFRVII